MPNKPTRDQRGANYHGHGAMTMKARDAIRAAGGNVKGVKGWDATHEGREKALAEGERIQRKLQARLEARDRAKKRSN